VRRGAARIGDRSRVQSINKPDKEKRSFNITPSSDVNKNGGLNRPPPVPFRNRFFFYMGVGDWPPVSPPPAGPSKQSPPPPPPPVVAFPGA